MSRNHYNENFLHNSKFSIKHRILSFSDETAIKEDTERVYTLYYYCINLYFNKEN